MNALTLRAVTVHHAGRPLVGPIDLELPTGTRLGLRGRSGAGKSTLLRAAVGLLPAELTVGGELTVLGEAVHTWRRSDRRWADLRARAVLVGQTPVVFDGSVLANAAFGLRHVVRTSRAELRERACAALVEAGLWPEVADRLDAAAHTLSVGQRQRLCLARALALDPDLLLLDEPTSALDECSRGVVEQAVADLTGRTLVLVSHDRDQVERLCDRTVNLDDRTLANATLAPRMTPSVLFVCVHNAGRSQMAAALLNHHARGAVEVRSAGSAPAETINPAVREVMLELGIDLATERPKLLTPDAVQASEIVITMGCGDVCPVFSGTRYLDWQLDDPACRSPDEVRPIRDEIDRRVRHLLTELLPTGRRD